MLTAPIVSPVHNWTSDNRTPSLRADIAICELLGLTYNPDQYECNMRYDATDKAGNRIEIKLDLYGSDKPTFFCEVSETFAGCTRPSSFGRPTTYSIFDTLLVFTQRAGLWSAHFIPAEHVEAISQQAWPTRTTRLGINGNASNRTATGKLVPWTELFAHPGVVTVALPPEIDLRVIYNGSKSTTPHQPHPTTSGILPSC